MTIRVVNLNKILKICQLPENLLTRELRIDLRGERRKALGLPTGGGHFHYPWWNAAKQHSVGLVDLETFTPVLIGDLKSRKRLYPLLTEGFLQWFRHLRRTTNAEIVWTQENIHTHYTVPGLELIVKVDNLLALKIGSDRHKIIYPYFFEEPALSSLWGRIGLWLMREALSEYDIVDMEILDVLRGRSFSGGMDFLKGDEEAIFQRKYMNIIEQWEALKPEYDL
ncbi:hypothetical protein [Sphingomonas montanisoli]|uniref:Uncharacterized protein n=1 Tax=Sphingomonas montanisoli TaxID=2606412 RepID=A0A5D9C314_9SPHN|nr:hypothetical protein [Sphingomonas montanisoli]TZG26258.1 hypothetical protein FYJ91_15055 [Sphingomonas montanisoli]